MVQDGKTVTLDSFREKWLGVGRKAPNAVGTLSAT